MCFALYISFLDIYKLKQNPWVLSKWISHLSCTSALTNGGFGSIFLFTISNNTLYFLLYNNQLHHDIMLWCHFCQHGVHQAGQKLAGKTIQTTKRTFPRTNCCFCFSFCCQKAEIYLPSARWQNTSWKYFNLKARRRRINFLSTTTARLREKGQRKYS